MREVITYIAKKHRKTNDKDINPMLVVKKTNLLFTWLQATDMVTQKYKLLCCTKYFQPKFDEHLKEELLNT